MDGTVIVFCQLSCLLFSLHFMSLAVGNNSVFHGELNVSQLGFQKIYTFYVYVYFFGGGGK